MIFLFFQTAETWQAVERLGFPIVIALVLAFAMFKVGKYLVNENAESNRFIREELTNALNANTEKVKETNDELKEIKTLLQNQQTIQFPTIRRQAK